MRKKSRQLQVLLGKNHHLFVVEIYQTFTFSSFVFSLYNSQAQPMSTARRPSKSTTEKVPLPDVTREKKCYTRSGPQADKLVRSRPSSHVGARPSTTKVLGPGPNPLHACPASIDRVPPIVSLKKVRLLSSFFLFSFFSSAPSLRCSFRFSSALLILPFCQKIHSCTLSKSLRVTMAIEQPTLWPALQASRPTGWDVNALRNFDDFHGAISCRIIANNVSSFR